MTQQHHHNSSCVMNIEKKERKRKEDMNQWQMMLVQTGSRQAACTTQCETIAIDK